MVGGKATDWSSVSRPSHKKQGRFCGLLLKWLHDMKLAKLRRRQESRGSPINVGAGHSMHKVLETSALTERTEEELVLKIGRAGRCYIVHGLGWLS